MRAHSKKFENHCHMVALYTVWYNFVRINKAVKMAPAWPLACLRRCRTRTTSSP